jgi:peptidyl-prolyl cis-trans isomerase D
VLRVWRSPVKVRRHLTPCGFATKSKEYAVVMMQGMRKASQSWVGKVLVGIMFTFLILSFAIWGIGDIFKGGYGRNIAAKVGSTDVTIEQLRTSYQNEIQRLTRQERRGVTPEAARARGIDRQVFSRLISEAAFDEEARKQGLAVSDAMIAETIMTDRSFQDASGTFRRNIFEEAMRNNGLTERGYVQDQRAATRRNHVSEAVSGDIAVPLAMLEAVHRYANERRSVEYMVLPASSVTVGAPDDATLKAYFETRKTAFRTPELRKASVVTLTPTLFATQEQISDKDLADYYDQIKAARFGAPERRLIQQISFQNADEAKAAAERIKTGASFDDIANARGVAAKDLEFGRLTRTEIIDKAIADAAFKLTAGSVSEPVTSRFSTVLLRVTEIDAESLKPLADVAVELRAEMGFERARQKMNDVHDKIEDQRASGKPLLEIAKAFSLTPTIVSGMDQTGRDLDGNVVVLPEQDALVAAIFKSDIGVDNEALRTRDGGYIWFDIAAVDQSRERNLDEVKAKAEAQWREDEIVRQLAEKGRGLVARLNQGEASNVVAASAGITIMQAKDLSRDQDAEGLSRAVLLQIFSTTAGKTGSAASGTDRIIFKVLEATVPPFIRTTQEMGILEGRLKTAFSDDILSNYVVALQKAHGLTVNDQAVRAILGSSN